MENPHPILKLDHNIPTAFIGKLKNYETLLYKFCQAGCGFKN